MDQNEQIPEHVRLKLEVVMSLMVEDTPRFVNCADLELDDILTLADFVPFITCPACGGMGQVVSETAELYRAELLPGVFALVAPTEPCDYCDGAGYFFAMCMS